jgi:hypothetical protein
VVWSLAGLGAAVATARERTPALPGDLTRT